MSIELRYKAYEKLYNKYATDVDPDEIAEKVKYLANQGDQQAAIKSFYEKYTGKPPTAEQLIYVSKYADPKSVGGLVDTENENIKSQNAAIKLEQEEKEASDLKAKEDEMLATFDRVYDGPKNNIILKKNKRRSVLEMNTANKKIWLDNYNEENRTSDIEEVQDSKLTDFLEEKAEYVSSIITGFSNEEIDNIFDLTNNARARELLTKLNNDKERKISENTIKDPNYLLNENNRIQEEIEVIKTNQSSIDKDSDKYKELEKEIKKLEYSKVNGLKVFEDIEAQDFFDAYDDLIQTGVQIGSDGQGEGLFSNDRTVNFPSFEQYEKRGYNKDQYDTYKRLNEVNQDAFTIQDISKKISPNAYNLDFDVDAVIAENSNEIQEIADRNNLDYDEVLTKIRNVGESGVEELTKIFNPQRDALEKEYDTFLRAQGFVKDYWMDDEFVKQVFPEDNEGIATLIQGNKLNVGVTKAAMSAYKSFLPDDIEEMIVDVRDGSDEIIYETVLDKDGKEQTTATTENDQTEFQKKQELLDTVNESMEAAWAKDPEIKQELESLKKLAVPELKAYKKELEANYDMSDMDDVAKVNELLAEKQNELVLRKLVQTSTFKRRSNEIGAAFGAISSELGIDFTRQQSSFTKNMDAIYNRKDFDWYNPANWVGELALGIGSGVEGITSSIGDSAVASIEGFVVRQKEMLETGLQEALDSGEISEDDLVDYQYGKWVKVDSVKGLGAETAKKKLKEIKDDKNYWNESIAKQMIELGRSTRRMEAYGGADFSDGVNLQEAFQTIGQALPHIGIAAAGGLSSAFIYGGAATTGSAVLGYLGTTVMGLQMYGDNYMSAIENNLAKNGLDKASIKKANPDFTEKQVQDEYNKNLQENFSTGEGANIATSAAFAAAQALLESYGAEQMVGATQKALKASSVAPGLAAESLFKATWDDIGQYTLDTLINSGMSSVKEFGTEYAQEVLGQISQGAQDTDENSLFKYIDGNAALQSGIGGAITGFALPFFGAVGKQSNIQIRRTAAKVNLFGGKNAAAISTAWYESSKKELDKKRKEGKITKKEYYQELKAYSASSNAGIKLRQGDFQNTMTKENRMQLHDLLVDAELMMQQINDAKGNVPLQNALKKELNVINNAATDIIITEREVSNLMKIADKKGFSDGVIVLDTKQDVIDYAKKNNIDYNADSTGLFDPKTNKMIVDRKSSEQMGEGTTAGHELMHKILFKTLYNIRKDGSIEGKSVVQGLSKSFDEYLNKIDINKARLTDANGNDTIYGAKLKLYLSKPDSMQAEEKFTLFRDALRNGDIKFNENIGTKIGDVFRRFFQSIGVKDVKFNTGKDVYNFIKDFNYEFDKGNLNKAQIKMMNEGAFVGENIERIQDDGDVSSASDNIALTNDSYEQTNRLLADEDFDAESSLDLRRAVKTAGGIIEATTKRLWRQGSLLTRDQFKKALENEYIQSLTEYDSNRDTGDNAGKSISNKFNLRANKVASDNITKKDTVSTDSEKAQQVADNTETKNFDEVETQKGTQREKVYASQTKQVESIDNSEPKAIIKDEVSKDILSLANKGENAATVAAAIKEEAKKSYFKELRKTIGTFSSDTYKNFVNSLDNSFIKALPVAAIKRRFAKVFGIKQTGITPTKQISKTGKPSYFNKQVFSVPKVTAEGLQEFKEYFLGGEKRQQSLYNLLATDFALESLQELMNDSDFMGKLQTALGNDGITALEFMQNIESKLDARGVENKSLDNVKLNIALDPKVRAKIKAKLNLNTAKNYINFSNKKLEELLGFTKIPTKKITYIKDGKTKTKSVRDFDAIFPETLAKGQKERTYRQVTNDVLNDFLGSISTAEAIVFREIFRNSIRGSDRLMYNTISEFDAAVPAIKGQIKKGTKLAKIASAIRVKYKKASNTATDQRGTVDNNLDYLSQVFKDNENLKIPELFKIFDNFGKYLRKADNMKYVSIFDAMMDDVGNNQNHFVRYLAPINFLPVNPETNKIIYNQKVAEEHSLPASTLGRLMLYASVTGQLETIKPFVTAAYMQGALLSVDDVKLNDEGLRSSMNEEFDAIFEGLVNGDLSFEQGLASLSRYTAGKGFINPNSYFLIKQGMTIAEYYGVKLPFNQQTPNAIKAQLKAINAQLQGMSKAEALADFKADMLPDSSKQSAVKDNIALNKNVFRENQTSQQQKDTMLNSYKTRVNAEKFDPKPKGISVFDFDDTLARTKEKVIVNMADGSTATLNAAEFAAQADGLLEQGAEFDFGEFENVVNAKKGPLADLALKRQGKFGSGDIFVLTARPQTSATGIKAFLDGIGLNLPLENITGLEDGSPAAKADWVLGKTAEGYNDFYFADDAISNVEAVEQILETVDVKSKVQLAKFNMALKLSDRFNIILEQSLGKESFKTYSKSRARLQGAEKDKGLLNFIKNQLTITPSAEDFMGLMYDIMGSGIEGNAHAQFILDNLMKPFNKAEQTVLSAKVAVANDFAALKAKFPTLKTSKLGVNPLMQQIGIGPYTRSHAVRVYIWAKQGMDIPGLSKRDQNALVAAVEADSELKSFADNVILIQKDSTYPPPGNSWTGGDMQSDILTGLDKGFRQAAMTEFNENVNAIFSEENLNKLEALLGTKWTEALKDSLRRMKAGSNRPVYQGGGARVVNNLLDWLNGSVGAIMFLNMRSGLLQLTSAVNFINWGDNNMYLAAKAFANQKQYWKDVIMLMNSDYLVNRRDGLKINVNEAELADAAKKGGMKGVLAKILDSGFVITRIMDTLAIATGGSTFFRNRVNALLKRQNPDTGKIYTKAEAEAKAFDDFYAIAEESQQSSNPSKISQQQASLAGRVILSFQNVTMQYNRKMKKAIRNLYNRRTNPGQTQRESDLGNLSQIIYYSTIQNVIFHSLQQALFAGLFDDDEDEDKKEKNKTASIANGMVDSLLFGLGFGGAAISTVKNVIIELGKQGLKKAPKYEEAVWSVFDFSPVLDSKVRKLKSSFKSFSWNMSEMKRRGWSIENPAYLAVSQVVAAFTNLPMDRAMRKIMNINAAMDEETRTWQRVALLLGWDTWSVGLPYWGLNSTVKKEEAEDAKIKADFKSDQRKLKASGYKKTMTPEKYEDVVEVKSPYGTIMFYYKTK